MKNFTERFEEMLDSIGVSAYRLAKELDTSDSVISTIRSGKNKPGFDFLSKLLSKYDVINIDYLLTGKGKLLKESGNTPYVIGKKSADTVSESAEQYLLSEEKLHKKLHPTLHPTAKSGPKSQKKEAANTGKNMIITAWDSTQYNLGVPKVITINERKEENIIYVPVKARAGYLSGYGDPEFVQTLPTLRIPGLDNATYRMFEADGPSMAPNIISGDRIIGQWVSNLHEIRENRVHVVVTKNGVVVKRVLNRIAQRGKLVFKSDTVTHRKEYPSYDVDPEDVLEIWYSRLKLSADFSEPVEIYHRINDLEAEMTDLRAENLKINDSIEQILKQIKPPSK